MSLGRDASPRSIVDAACDRRADTPKGFNLNLTLREYESAYTLAAAYNGWRVPSTAAVTRVDTSDVNTTTCVRDLLHANTGATS